MRMLVADTPICLMDESFSAIDASIAHSLQSALLAMDKTIIMVTHKLSQQQLELFDEIILIEGGKIVHSGTYAELLNISEFNRLQSAS